MFSNCINSFVGLLVSIFLSPSCVGSLDIEFHEHTQKDKWGYNSMYVPPSLAEKVEGRTMVRSLLTAGPCEEEHNLWKEPCGHEGGRGADSVCLGPMAEAVFS